MRGVWLIGVAMLAGCGSQPKAMSVEDATVRLPAVAGRPGAAYFTLKGGAVEERLMNVSSPMAVRAELHDMTMDGNVMKMAPIEGGLAVPAGATVEFKSGGKHVMLFDVSPKAEPGGKIPLTLSFASGATLSAEAAAQSPGGDHEGH